VPKQVNLKALSFDDLLQLQEKVSTIIARRVKVERTELEARLARLQDIRLSSSRVNSRSNGTGHRKTKKVAPKYRNPENRTETWTGRGRQPRWLTAAIKAGKKRSNFLIASAK
jgi:DNA-binding protein H-NS